GEPRLGHHPRPPLRRAAAQAARHRRLVRGTARLDRHQGFDDRRRAHRPAERLMDGIHDLGGRQGFGRVRHSPTAPAFHGDWEKRVNALYTLAVRSGIFNMDEYRHAIERMEPRHYVSASYYERTLTSLATLLVEKGLVTRDELERRAQGSFP